MTEIQKQRTLSYTHTRTRALAQWESASINYKGQCLLNTLPTLVILCIVLHTQHTLAHDWTPFVFHFIHGIEFIVIQNRSSHSLRKFHFHRHRAIIISALSSSSSSQHRRFDRSRCVPGVSIRFKRHICSNIIINCLAVHVFIFHLNKLL